MLFVCLLKKQKQFDQKDLPSPLDRDWETAELAAKKSNFSGWVRDKLRSERNQSEKYKDLDHEDREEAAAFANYSKLKRYNELDATLERAEMTSRQLLWHLEQRTDEEIKALVALLRHVK